MMIQIGNVLTAEDLAQVRSAMLGAEFEDGRNTAGWNARLVKNNMQARGGAAMDTIRRLVAERILAHEVFALAVRPKALTPLIFSRYGAGHAYGSHVDDAVMGGLRTDVSFTLFLSDPGTYDGGELVIESAAGEEAVKLPAGSLVAYASPPLHRVEPVTRGERMAAVGWARSFVRDAARREILFDLDRARRSLFAREGKTPEFDLMSKSTANLMRMWMDD